MGNYRLLADAVILQASNDYRRALCKQHSLSVKDELDSREVQALKKIESEVRELERFFSGEDIMLYTRLDGRMIMDRLKQEIADLNYDISAVDKRYLNRSNIPEEED